MAEAETIGYTKEEYYKISEKHGLPKRCPILRDCCRATKTRYMMCFKLSRSGITFDEFLDSEGQRWEPDNMIKQIEQISIYFAPDSFYSIENSCPEVTLFEPDYLFKFKQSAFGEATYDKEATRRFEAVPKHYSECAEFSEYTFLKSGENKLKGLNRASSLEQIPEKKLENYLVDNFELLEPGLKFIGRQKSIGKWAADIFASDSWGNDVLIELKSKTLNRNEIHMLTGQVSKYFNQLKKKSHNLRLIIVLPRSNKNRLDDLYQGLQHWIENKKVSLFQFDYFLYDKKFIFSKVIFD